MTKYSRKQKYEELRNRIANDVESDIHSKDLSSYEKRLNQINANTFKAPEEESNHQYRSPSREKVVENVKPSTTSVSDDLGFDIPPIKAENTTTFESPFLKDYLSDVKQYNVEQGNAFSDDTTVNILRSLRGEKPQPVLKPFMDETAEVEPKPVSKPVLNDTTTIPFQSATPTYPEFDEPTNTMSKEDIAQEVQNLINGISKSSSQAQKSTQDTSSYDTNQTERQKLLNETTQMRAQLDDYEENLYEMNEKMQRTNRILNVVFIVLIVALLVAFSVVVYWILMERGII